MDTVLTVFADGLGRLMGKRVVGRYFLDHVLHDGVHACIYLFTVDMEMEPLPGFKLASWERGYGDMKLVPDLTTWRLLPWLPKTALVFCDVYTEEGEPIEEAPRWVLRRQLERAAKVGYRVKTASELELYLFRETFDEARAKRYHGLTPVSNYLEDYHILQTSREEPLVRAIRNGMEAARVPVEFSKGEWGRGQEEINLRYADALEMADRHVLYKHGVKEIAYQQGCSVTFMAKYDMGAAGSSFHLHSSVWDQAGRRNLFAAKDGGRQGTPLFQQWLAGQMAMAREFAYFYAPTVNAYKRYQAGSFAPDADRVGLGQSHLRLPRSAEKAAASGSRTASRAPTPTPIWPSRPPSRRGCAAWPRSWRRPRCSRAMPTRTRSWPRCRRRCATRSPRSRARRPRARRSAQGRGALPPARAARAAGVRPVRHRLGADPPLRKNLGPSPRPSPLGERGKDEADARKARGQGRADHRRGNGHGTRGVGALRPGGRSRRGLRSERRGRRRDGGAGAEGGWGGAGGGGRRGRRGRGAPHGRGRGAPLRGAPHPLQQRGRALEGPRPVGARDGRRAVGPGHGASTSSRSSG